MKYGLSEGEFKFLEETLIIPVKEYKARVFLFGSRATGQNQKFSDIDLLYFEDSQNPIPPGFIFKLLSTIEESRFPYKVDLVNYNELASGYKSGVDKEKIEL